MAKHQGFIEGFDVSLEEAARRAGNMKYDSLAEYIGYLADDLKRQADADREKGRVTLAEGLYDVVRTLRVSQEKMEGVWKICEPFMK